MIICAVLASNSAELHIVRWINRSASAQNEVQWNEKLGRNFWDYVVVTLKQAQNILHNFSVRLWTLVLSLKVGKKLDSVLATDKVDTEDNDDILLTLKLVSGKKPENRILQCNGARYLLNL